MFRPARPLFHHDLGMLPLPLKLISGEEIFLDPYRIETICDHKYFLPVPENSAPDVLPEPSICCKVTTSGASAFFVPGKSCDFLAFLNTWAEEEHLKAQDKYRAEQALFESEHSMSPQSLIPPGVSPEMLQEALLQFKPILKSVLTLLRDAREELDEDSET